MVVVLLSEKGDDDDDDEEEEDEEEEEEEEESAGSMFGGVGGGGRVAGQSPPSTRLQNTSTFGAVDSPLPIRASRSRSMLVTAALGEASCMVFLRKTGRGDSRANILRRTAPVRVLLELEDDPDRDPDLLPVPSPPPLRREGRPAGDCGAGGPGVEGSHEDSGRFERLAKVRVGGGWRAAAPERSEGGTAVLAAVTAEVEARAARARTTESAVLGHSRTI